jgi:hypothetical protein
MAKIELIYFSDCPNVAQARASLLGSGIRDYSEVRQDQLCDGDPRKSFSSPSLAVDGILVVGSSSQGPSCSLHAWSPEFVRKALSGVKS